MYLLGYDENDYRRDLEDYFREYEYDNALRAMDYVIKMHDGQKRMSGQSFYVHPLYVAWHGFNIGMRDENWVCANLLHDVCEECEIRPDQIPFEEEVRTIVWYLTLDYDFEDGDDQDERFRKKIIAKAKYYARLMECPKALCTKGVDRYDNMRTTDYIGVPATVKNIIETDTRLLPNFRDAMRIKSYREYRFIFNTIYTELGQLNIELAKRYNVPLRIITQ